jgi:hypothetical protein
LLLAKNDEFIEQPNQKPLLQEQLRLAVTELESLKIQALSLRQSFEKERSELSEKILHL